MFDRRSLLAGIAALAVAPALPKPAWRGHQVVGIDVAGPDYAAVVSYKGNIYRAVHYSRNDGRWRP